MQKNIIISEECDVVESMSIDMDIDVCMLKETTCDDVINA